MHAVQAPTRRALCDRLVGEPELAQLAPRHHAVLALGERRDLRVRRS
jgi:hypothetical protein